MKTFSEKKTYEAENATIEAYKEQGVEIGREKKVSSSSALVFGTILVTIAFICAVFTAYLYAGDVKTGAEAVINGIKQTVEGFGK